MEVEEESEEELLWAPNAKTFEWLQTLPAWLAYNIVDQYFVTIDQGISFRKSEKEILDLLENMTEIYKKIAPY